MKSYLLLGCHADFSGFSVSVREGTFHGGFNLRQVCGMALLPTNRLDATQSISLPGRKILPFRTETSRGVEFSSGVS